MNGWKETTLGDELELIYGKALPEKSREPGNVAVYGSNGAVGSHTEKLADGPGIIVGRKGSVGEVAFSEGPYWAIDTSYYVKPKNDFNWRYLYYLLLSLKGAFKNTHSTVPGLNRETVYPVTCTIAPRDEQNRIAAVLRKIQQAIEVETNLIRVTRELEAAVMRKLFTEGLYGEPQKETEIGMVPESWRIQQLGDPGFAKIGNGSTPKKANQQYWVNGTIPWLTSGKIHEGVIETADIFVTPLAKAECHLPLVPEDSLLVAITGQGKTLGNTALVRFPTCINQHLAYITFLDSDVVPWFMLFYLQSRYEEFRAVGRAGGSTKAALTCAYLKSVKVPVPPRDEQERIGRYIRTIDADIEALEKKLSVLNELFNVALQELMSGNIRVTNLKIDTSCLEHDIPSKLAPKWQEFQEIMDEHLETQSHG